MLQGSMVGLIKDLLILRVHRPQTMSGFSICLHLSRFVTCYHNGCHSDWDEMEIQGTFDLY